MKIYMSIITKNETGWTFIQWLEPRQGHKFLLQRPQTDSWAYEDFYSMAAEKSFSTSEAVESEAHHLPSCKAKFKSKCICSSTPSYAFWRALGLGYLRKIMGRYSQVKIIHNGQSQRCLINKLVKAKSNLLYIRNQSVPRCKHFTPQL